MPEFDTDDQKKEQKNTGKSTEKGAKGGDRGERRKRHVGRASVASALNIEGDATRANQFNKHLDELFKEQTHDWLKYGHVHTSKEASINYMCITNDDGEAHVAAIVFETKSTYRRGTDQREAVFTYDLLTSPELRKLIVERVSDDLEVNEDNVYVLEAQIVPPTYKITEESSQHLAYNTLILIDQLSGGAPDELDVADFDLYEATFDTNPLSKLPGMYDKRSDFSIRVDVGRTRRDRSRPDILDNEISNELGSSRLHGVVDLEYTGPEEGADTFRGNLETFKPEQFTTKIMLTAVELVGENNIYARGLLALAAMGEAHQLETPREVLERRVLNDKATNLNALADTMWLPKDVAMPTGKKDEDIINLLDKMVYKSQSIISFLQRDGDMTSGILHLLSKVGQGDSDYLDALLVELDNLSPVEERDEAHSVTNRYARFIGLKGETDLQCGDFVSSYTPRVFGKRAIGDGSYPLDFVDTIQLAEITNGNPNLYGLMINAISLEDRRVSVEESKETQIRFFEELSVEFDGIGAEYGVNPKLVEFLNKEISAMFRDTHYNKFNDRREGFRSYHRTSRDNSSLIMGRRGNSSAYTDSRTSSFGNLRR